jgi:hypothetical protein
MDDRGSVPGGSNDGSFSLHHRVQTGYVAHLASYPAGTGEFFCGKNGWGVKPTTHLHPVTRLRTRGAVPPRLRGVVLS